MKYASGRYFHEALKLRGDDFAGRFQPDSMQILTKGRGIALQNDLDQWRVCRTALLQAVTMRRRRRSRTAVVGEAPARWRPARGGGAALR